ncbi:Type cbb3 cytochrome oxidase biogenesis protein CcoS, involved in heme b insertion [hydrothermal vent metagenome]|uniref:Type cbb3 cytochrome oxidase biogenesis protein CcoS, involved in heme b insertion n=1 Tax=hydrothermal vent metagenome TaxID=652676 RepID=A0A3B0TG97_9ZZZZ
MMNILVYLIPLALLLGLGGLAVFLWALRTGQFDDLEGDAHRILDDSHDQRPIEDKDVPQRKNQDR